jgi:O-antigen ligase
LIRAAGNGMLMNKKKLHELLAFVSLAMLFFAVIIHVHFVILPVFFLALGLLSYLWSGRKALVLFLFLLPLINSTPDIFFNGYPFNYMGVALFYLSGMMLASHIKKEKAEFAFPGYGIYLLFLSLIGVSVFFVLLRWSNLTLSPLAFLRDTPVAPSGERVSFACIFPAITLALFSLAPFLASSIRFWHLKENEIFTPLKAGFCLSFLLALVQKWFAPDFLAQSWWRLQKNQVNGGFSDFNAFGFFAGALFLYQALRLIGKFSGFDDIAVADRSERSAGFPHRLGFKAWSCEIIFLMIALAAIFVSGCRTAFLFVLLAVGYLIFSKKTIFWVKVTVVLALAVSLLVAGGTLKKRLQESVARTAYISDTKDAFRVADEVSSGRLAMLNDSLQMIGRFPISGVGAGNFLFYLKYLHFGEKAYLDLPLNQFLLIFSETGLGGGLLFILFLAILLKRQKKGSMRIITAAIVFALLFNNFFWFPECLLLFWIFLSGSDWRDAPGWRLKPAWLWAVVATFVAFQVFDFRALHPESLTRQKGVAYDYGFWPGEKSERGTFFWTRGAAGKYFTADSARDFAIFCGAPFARLKKENMTVKLFWRGKLFQRTVFFENGLKKFRLPRGQEGFLEIRVHPTFNLKAMNLGVDPRELGVQFIEAAGPLP